MGVRFFFLKIENNLLLKINRAVERFKKIMSEYVRECMWLDALTKEYDLATI